MFILHGYCRAVTCLNHWLAVAASLLVFVMVGAIAYEVVARYFFDAPTVWALELSTLLLGPYFMLAGPHLLHTAGHVNVDILHSKLPARLAGWVDAVIYPLIAVICVIVIDQSIPVAMNALESRETSFSAWNPPVWPVKVLIPVAFLLLLLQALAETWGAIQRGLKSGPDAGTEALS
ncbi:TRAP transporter small permease subunit [Marinobacter zhejiangensis]|uniref:TRAP transporter small permease protein n=1 Tax=Marinobacter zhejiangensis TaxID=488535 RepID=A0A1I4LV76_9GAMM|nr:TRAP transporter small permease subunit [Marinobacter zhejiangensis]SFL94835.1 TRAP-type mannitol/chloroaromatic compound transport system, small permease component [Marinobacter zhejiangensis]